MINVLSHTWQLKTSGLMMHMAMYVVVCNQELDVCRKRNKEGKPDTSECFATIGSWKDSLVLFNARLEQNYLTR